MRSWIALSVLALGACAAETSSPPIEDRFEVVNELALYGAPGRPLDSLIVVRLLNDRGEPMAGVGVTWSVVLGGGKVSPLGGVTGEDGLATARWTLGSAVGENRVQALSAQGTKVAVSAEARGFEAIAVATAVGAVCALAEGGAVWCWAGGDFGNTLYGPATWDYGVAPTLVDSGHAFVAIEAGDAHFCARTAGGEIWCWGNRALMLGRSDGSVPILTPAPVAGGHTWVTMAAADYGMLAIDDAGKVWRWGNTWEYDSYSAYDLPEQASPDSVQFTAIAAGYEHICAIASDDRVWCQGHSDVGQLGDTTGMYEGLFRPVSSDARFRQVVIGDHWTCGLDLASAIWCWGGAPVYPYTESRVPRRVNLPLTTRLEATWDAVVMNRTGQPWIVAPGFRGTGAPALQGLPSQGPVQIAAPAVNVVALDVRGSTICFVREDRQLLCAGQVPGYGQTDTPIGILTP